MRKLFGNGLTLQKTFIFSLTAFILLLFTQPVFAEGTGEMTGPWDRLDIRLGGFIASLNSDVRIGSQTRGLGVDIDLEDTLGLDESKSVFRADASCRFTRSGRHMVNLSYLDFRRHATRIIAREIEFGDQTFILGTNVNSTTNIRIFKGTYSYSLLLDDRMDVALSAGAYIMPIDVGMSATGVGSETESFTAPLPVLGLRTNFALTKKLFLKQKVDFFWLKIDNFKGSLVNANISLEYNVFKYVGLGLGFETFRFGLEAKGEDYPKIDFRGNIKFNYSGAMLYTKIYF